MVDTHVTVVHVVKLRKIWVRSSIQDTRDDKHGSYIYLAWYVFGIDAEFIKVHTSCVIT